MRGIEAATFIPSGHKRRAQIQTSETTSLSPSASPSSFTAMMNDVIGKETVVTSTPYTLPRFKVLSIDDHKIDGRGRLSYNVQWEGAGSLDTREPYSELHHLDTLDKYELTIRAARSNDISSLTRQAATKWRVYQLQKGVELL
jgi:hypothetical protein